MESDDSALHLRWLLRALKDKAPSLAALRGKGWWMDIGVYWDSDAGHGGPTLDSTLLGQLGSLGIELWFDIYFSGALDYTSIVKRACATHAKERA